jgi:hypothetical protein
VQVAQSSKNVVEEPVHPRDHILPWTDAMMCWQELPQAACVEPEEKLKIAIDGEVLKALKMNNVLLLRQF